MSVAWEWQSARKPWASGLPRSIARGAGKEKPPISRVRNPFASQDEELAFERVGLDPDQGKPWPEGQVEPNDRRSLFDLVAFWFGRHGHGQSLCHGEARKSKLPTCERCATSLSGQGSGRRKTPSMPRFFPHGFIPAVFPASRSVEGGRCRPDGRSFTARKAVWCCGLSCGFCSGHGALIQPSSISRWHLYPINGPSEAIHSISVADTVE